MRVVVPEPLLAACVGFASVAACVHGNYGYAAYETPLYEATLEGEIVEVEAAVRWRGGALRDVQKLTWPDIDAALAACEHLCFPARDKHMWFSGGVLHRDGDLPSYKDPWCMQWHRRGLLHRDGDLPAIIFKDGAAQWYVAGRLHRDGGMPAVLTCAGTREWYVAGQRTSMCKTSFVKTA
jgi:hypothetical protein